MADEKTEDKKTEQNDPKGKILKHEQEGLRIGASHNGSSEPPCMVIDSHMHIMSGHCSPMPFLWGNIQSSLFFKRVDVLDISRRSWIEGGGLFLMGAGDLLKLIVTLPRRAAGVFVDTKNEHGEYYNKFAMRMMIVESKEDTYTLARNFMRENRKMVYKTLKAKPPYNIAPRLVFPVIAMPMDMEYAHIDGYFGVKIYNAIYKDRESMEKDEKPYRYWFPLHGLWKKREDTYQLLDAGHAKNTWPADGQTRKEYNEANPGILGRMYRYVKGTPASDGIRGVVYAGGDESGGGQTAKKSVHIDCKPCLMPNEETKQYEGWQKQVENTELAMFHYPLDILPLFHYDPRRWQLKGNQRAFENVVNQGLYLGFKMYTAQGYRPWDVNRLPILKDFYAFCEKNNICITNHCTPEGAATYEADEYIRLLHPNDRKEDLALKSNVSYPKLESNAELQKKIACSKDKKNVPEHVEDSYFKTNFISPKAWLPVLEAHPRLRLCLAHFGGDTDLGRVWGLDIIEMMKTYTNLHVDISSSFASQSFRNYFFEKIVPGNESIHGRILFATDWYMTLLDNVKYPEYFEKAKKALDDYGNNLWVKFAFHNPYRFFRLDVNIRRIAKNIIKKRQDPIIIKKMKSEEQDKGKSEVQKDLTEKDINEKAEFIAKAIESQNIYEETP